MNGTIAAGQVLATDVRSRSQASRHGVPSIGKTRNASTYPDPAWPQILISADRRQKDQSRQYADTKPLFVYLWGVSKSNNKTQLAKRGFFGKSSPHTFLVLATPGNPTHAIAGIAPHRLI